MDKKFRVGVLSKTPNPQQVIYAALHQDYSSHFIFDATLPSEEKCGEIAVRKLLSVNHYGPLEHPQINFAVGYFPHSVMQQARTHRIGTSFDRKTRRKPLASDMGISRVRL